MLAKRIIPCLDVKDGKVVKGVQFKQHKIIGDALELAQYYCDNGADELVFYDITASLGTNVTNPKWIEELSSILDIPFCVAGGIRTLNDATRILNSGADKVSINSPALENPHFITELSNEFGKQCVVVGIDSYEIENDYYVCQYTGDPDKSKRTLRKTFDWIDEVISLGAGEIVLNCMKQDGMKAGYDLKQLSIARTHSSIPLIASGGAGTKEHFLEVFKKSNVDGALAAGAFHRKELLIPELKSFLKLNQIEIRI